MPACSKDKMEWLRGFLTLPLGIRSHDKIQSGIRCACPSRDREGRDGNGGIAWQWLSPDTLAAPKTASKGRRGISSRWLTEKLDWKQSDGQPGNCDRSSPDADTLSGSGIVSQKTAKCRRSPPGQSATPCFDHPVCALPVGSHFHRNISLGLVRLVCAFAGCDLHPDVAGQDERCCSTGQLARLSASRPPGSGN